MADENTDFAPSPNPNTPDPEYNIEAVHSDADAPWFTQEEPADETYRPHDEPVIHDYEPQDRAEIVGTVEAYTPKVNTGNGYPPDAHEPAVEEKNLHIVTYGTVEDVAYADGDESRENGLVSMSIRDSMDDLIHTDFHTLNPLSLLGPDNVRIGDRVRVDIQDYKNVIEWFVYNYPTVLEHSDLLQARSCDGPHFTENMPTTEQGTPVELFGKECIGGSITDEPRIFSPTTGGEDFEHPLAGSSQLDKSYLEIGQMDGNKKITLSQFLYLINGYFHITELWNTVRDHEKRLVHLERDLREEDLERVTMVHKEIGMMDYVYPVNTDPKWPYTTEEHGFPSDFFGSIEQNYFTLRINYVNAVEEQPHREMYFIPFHNDIDHNTQHGISKIFAAGTIPEAFRPSQFRWVKNYGHVTTAIGSWMDLISFQGSIDIGFHPDGSVWVDCNQMDDCSPHRGEMGIFGLGGDPDHMWWLNVVPGSIAQQTKTFWIRYWIRTYGGIISIDNGW